MGDAPATTYGRLLADEWGVSTWRHGDVRVDLVDVLATDDQADGLTAWRIHDGELVVFAGTNTPGLIETTTDTTEAMRDVLGIPAGLRRASIRLTNRQRHFVDRYADLLEQLAAFPARPYPPGTRIRVVLPDGREADGTVLAAAPRSGGGTTYRWRPDVADLPGHPWQHQPIWAMETTELHATDILGSRTSAHDESDLVLATGAVVRTIDDPRFAVGTVRRAMRSRHHPPTYEVQPHDAPIRPVVLPIDAVSPLRPTVWPTLDALLAARRQAGLDLLPRELLVTTAESAVVVDSPDGSRVYPTRRASPGPPDPTVGIQPIAVPAESPRLLTLRSRTASATTVQSVGTIRLVRDPTHGDLAVSEAEFHLAVALGPDRLAAMLARQPWVPLGNLPLETTAALAAIHVPERVLATSLRRRAELSSTSSSETMAEQPDPETCTHADGASPPPRPEAPPSPSWDSEPFPVTLRHLA